MAPGQTPPHCENIQVCLMEAITEEEDGDESAWLIASGNCYVTVVPNETTISAVTDGNELLKSGWTIFFFVNNGTSSVTEDYLLCARMVFTMTTRIKRDFTSELKCAWYLPVLCNLCKKLTDTILGPYVEHIHLPRSNAYGSKWRRLLFRSFEN